MDLKDGVLKYVDDCGWRVKPVFKEQLELGILLNTKVPQTFVLLDNNKIIGFYQFIKCESIKNKELTPWISTLFIDKKYCGKRLGEKLLNHGRRYAYKLGYSKVYLSTDHIQLYEKMGFYEIGLGIDKWGHPTKIYEHDSLE